MVEDCVVALRHEGRIEVAEGCWQPDIVCIGPRSTSETGLKLTLTMTKGNAKESPYSTEPSVLECQLGFC